MDMHREETWSRAPWSTKPSLKLMAEEVGVDFDRLIDAFRDDLSDVEAAAALNVPAGTVAHLREHFMRYGVDSVEGQD